MFSGNTDHFIWAIANKKEAIIVSNVMLQLISLFLNSISDKVLEFDLEDLISDNKTAHFRNPKHSARVG